MNSNQQRIQELAHQIWESEGKPHDRATHHWDEACKLLAAEESIEHQMGTNEINGFTETAQQEASLEKKPRKRKIVAADETSSTITPEKPKKSTAKKSKSVTTEH